MKFTFDHGRLYRESRLLGRRRNVRASGEEFDMSPDSKNNTAPGINREANTMNLTFEQFKANLAAGLKQAYRRAVVGWKKRRDRIKQRRAQKEAQGKYYRNELSPDPSSYNTELEGQMARGTTNFHELVDEIAHHAYSKPDVQRGSVDFVQSYESAYNYFWDVVQQDGHTLGFEEDHPLFKTSTWKRDMKVPGMYVDGRLSRMSMNHAPRFKRRMSGELPALRKRPRTQSQIQSNVDLRHRDLVTEHVKNEYGTLQDIPEKERKKGGPTQKLVPLSDLQFDKIEWNEVEQGDDEGGFAHVIEINKPGRQTRGEYLPGDEPKEGVVLVEADPDNPRVAEVRFIDYDKADKLFKVLGNDAMFKMFIETPGYFEPDVQASLKRLVEMPESDRTWKEYSDDVTSIAMYKSGEMALIVNFLEKENKINYDERMALKNPDTAEPTAQKALRGLMDKIKAGANGGVSEAVWKKVLGAMCSDYMKSHPTSEGGHDDWWDAMKSHEGFEA